MTGSRLSRFALGWDDSPGHKLLAITSFMISLVPA
jgi:hypothetical protein